MNLSEERRQDVRYAPDGLVYLTYNGSVIEGALGDISTGGILGNFKTINGYPRLLETVSVEVELNSMRVAGLAGLVIRLQAGEAIRGSEYVKVALKFDAMLPDKIAELRTFVISFQRLLKESAS